MRTLKHRLQAYFMPLATVLSVVFLTTQGIALPLDTPSPGDCNEALQSVVADQARLNQTFISLEHLELNTLFQFAEDRVLFRIAKTATDPVLSLVTKTGLQEFKNYSDRLPHLEEFLNSISSRQIDATQTADWMAQPSTHPLERILILRGKEDWNGIIRIFETELNAVEKNYPHIRLQSALAYNRRNKLNDRIQAESIASSVISDPSVAKDPDIISEAYGILARIYKDHYSATGASHYLEKAIDTYLSGFHFNPENYYPGVAALELLWTIPGPEAQKEAEALFKLVKTALDQSLQKNPNFWAYATKLSLLLKNKNWIEIAKVVPKLIETGTVMSLQSSLDGYTRLAETWKKDLSVTESDQTKLQGVLDQLKVAVENLKSDLANRPSIAEPYRKFPDTEGAISVTPLFLTREMKIAEIELDITPERSKIITQESVQKFLQNYQVEKNRNPGYLLGATGPFKKAVGTLADRTGHTPWWNAYEQVGLELNPKYTNEFLNKISKTDKPIIMLIPHHFQKNHLNSVTWQEYQWLLKNYSKVHGHIEFVYGAYDLLGIDFYQKVSERQGNQYSERHMMQVLKSAQDYLLDLGKAVQW